jgi:hypothetical protein
VKTLSFFQSQVSGLSRTERAGAAIGCGCGCCLLPLLVRFLLFLANTQNKLIMPTQTVCWQHIDVPLPALLKYQKNDGTASAGQDKGTTEWAAHSYTPLDSS